MIAAFDEICRELGESRRFETLVYFFRNHECLPPDDYSIDFMVSIIERIYNLTCVIPNQSTNQICVQTH